MCPCNVLHSGHNCYAGCARGAFCRNKAIRSPSSADTQALPQSSVGGCIIPAPHASLMRGGLEVWRVGGVEGWRCGRLEVWKVGGVEGWRCGGVYRLPPIHLSIHLSVHPFIRPSIYLLLYTRQSLIFDFSHGRFGQSGYTLQIGYAIKWSRGYDAFSSRRTYVGKTF